MSHTRFTRRGLCALIAAAVVTVAPAAPAAAQPFVGQNFTASSRPTDSTFIPPDTMGAAGVDHFVELINGRYSVYRKRDGVRVQTSTLNAFWAAAGAPHTGSFSFDPRALYDPYVQRWYALSVDNPGGANNFLVAVSNTSDPTQGWRGFKIDADADDSHWADFPMLGYNRDTVVISANMFGIGGGSTQKGFVVIPKSDLLLPNPTVANATSFQDVSAALTGFSVQPAVDMNDGVLPLPLLSRTTSTALKRSSIAGSAFAPVLATAGGTITVANHAAAPNADQPGPKAHINVGDTRFSGNVILNNGELWAVHTVNVNNRAAARWYRINAATNTVIESGTIADASLAYFFPSIAVNDLGDVVIGFSGTDPNTFVSTYAVVGKTSGGVTAFGTPFQTKAGVSDYERLDGSGRNRWGDYSATTLDPTDPSIFWTIQEYVSATDQWSTQVTEIIVPQPGEARWKNPAAGNFSTAAAWFGDALPAPGSHVIFSRSTAPSPTPYTVTFSGDVSVDRLSARQGRVRLDLAGNALMLINSSVAQASLMVGEFGGAPALTVANGTLNTQNVMLARRPQSVATLTLENATWSGTNLWVGGDNAQTGGAATIVVHPDSSMNITGTTRVRGGGFIQIQSDAAAAHVGSLSMEGGRLSLFGGGNKVLHMNALFMSAGAGRIDLTDNAMIVDYSGSTFLPTVRERIIEAYAGGSWSGQGITSSFATATSFALGYTEAAAVLAAFPATFFGQTVDDTSVLVRFTRYGDANLDGVVNLADFNRLAANFGSTSALWWMGDFNYDGVVNLADFNLLAANFGLSASGPGVTPEDWSALAAAVPEPGSAALMALCVPLLSRRRRGVE